VDSAHIKGRALAGLTSITYRSRAVEPMSVDALRKLEHGAQARNRAEGVTGLALYDQGHFFQWLEGPVESIARVWESVRQDRRHTDIADVRVGPTATRMFDGCDMKLAIRGEEAVPGPEQQAPLLSLVPTLDPLVVAAPEGEAAVRWGSGPATVPIVPFLPVLVQGLVLPQILAKHAAKPRLLPPVSPVAARLSRLLLDDDAKPAAKVLRRLYASTGSLSPLCATVIEPAARSLGDLWLVDDCSQLDVTMALVRLHTILRQLNAAATPVTIGLPVVLVAPQPGEVHLLGAGLDAELLWQAGWDTHREFPETDHALQALLAESWFDVLDLSLSPALQHRDSLPLMAETISGARAASLNPALTVVVGGRAFYEQCEGSLSVGADATTTSASQVVRTATAALQATLTKLADQTALVTSS
jgi:hypothetical protein